MELSLVVPVHNEVNSVRALLDSLEVTLSQLKLNYEIIFVNDGSTDGTTETLAQLSGRAGVTVISLVPQQGKTAAWQAGFAAAAKEYVATIDGDMENDAEDLLKLTGKALEGYDVISGWRKDRWLDRRFSRRVPSIVASHLLSALSGIRLHDYGCGLKMFKTSLLKNLNLRSGDHRLLPALLACDPAKITEVEVNWRPRRYGRTKYGLGRIWQVLFSLPGVYRCRRKRQQLFPSSWR